MVDQLLTQAQVMEQLKTRGFESGGFRSPLRYFRGKLDSITGAMVQRGSMQQARLEVTYNFSEVEIFESTEPYPFPVAQVSIMYSGKDKSAMGVLGQSIDKIVNAGEDENKPQEMVKNQDALVGVVQEWKVTPGHMMPDKDDQGKWGEKPREAWEVIWAEGFGGMPHGGMVDTEPKVEKVAPSKGATTAETPAQRAINLLDGKTQQQWNNVVFQDAMVKKDPQLVNIIITGQFLAPLEESGVISKDKDGVYHVIPF